jgi:hypothetical protein
VRRLYGGDSIRHPVNRSEMSLQRVVKVKTMQCSTF